MGIIEIEIPGWDTYNTKSDHVRQPNWFRLSRDIGSSPGLTGLSAAEKWIWVLILAERCKKKTKTIQINPLWLADQARETLEVAQSAISKLEANGTIKIQNCQPTVTTLTVNCQSTERVVQSTHRLEHTGRDKTEHNKVGGGVDSAREPKLPQPNTLTPPPATSNNLGSIHPTLMGNSRRDQVLCRVPDDIQAEWVDRYESIWLKNSLNQAIEHYTRGGRLDVVSDWPAKLTRWFQIEKKPQLRPRAPPDPIPIHPSPSPYSEGARERALADPALAANYKKALGKVSTQLEEFA